MAAFTNSIRPSLRQGTPLGRAACPLNFRYLVQSEGQTRPAAQEGSVEQEDERRDLLGDGRHARPTGPFSLSFFRVRASLAALKQLRLSRSIFVPLLRTKGLPRLASPLSRMNNFLIAFVSLIETPCSLHLSQPKLPARAVSRWGQHARVADSPTQQSGATAQRGDHWRMTLLSNQEGLPG